MSGEWGENTGKGGRVPTVQAKPTVRAGRRTKRMGKCEGGYQGEELPSCVREGLWDWELSQIKAGT